VRGAVFVDSADQATKPDIDLFLFAETAPTLAADNAAFAPTDAEMLNCIGVISFAGANFKAGDITAGANGNGVIPVQGQDIPFSAPVNKVIYGVLVARNAYTPVANEVLAVNLTIEEPST
jgi:hypothetical protein